MLIQLQFIYKYKLKLLRWNTGTLSHNSALVYPMLVFINILWWYSGRMAHGSDVVYTLLPNQLQFVLTCIYSFIGFGRRAYYNNTVTTMAQQNINFD
jgi:hypothetical protein